MSNFFSTYPSTLPLFTSVSPCARACLCVSFSASGCLSFSHNLSLSLSPQSLSLSLTHTHMHTHTHTHPTHSALHLGQVGEHIECLSKLGPTHRRCTHDCLGRSCVRPAIQTPLANTWRPRWRNAPLLKLPGPPQRELSVAERAALDILERHGRLRDPDRAVVDNFVPHLRPYLSLLSR